jgi:hypothetical protein
MIVLYILLLDADKTKIISRYKKLSKRRGRVDWPQVAHDKIEGRTLVNTVMTIWKDSWLFGWWVGRSDGQFTRMMWRCSLLLSEGNMKLRKMTNIIIYYAMLIHLLYTLKADHLSEQYGTLTHKYNRPT